MVDVKKCLPELRDRKFNRENFMEDFDQPMEGIEFLIQVVSERQYVSKEIKTISLQDMVLGVKNDDGFEKVIKYIFDYLTNNNSEKTEREVLLYMYLLTDEIKSGISEFKQ